MDRAKRRCSCEEAATAPHSPTLMQFDDHSHHYDHCKDLFQQLLDQDCNEPAHPHHPHHHHYHLIAEEHPHDDGHPGCKCTKIDCLKLYCQCFAKGRPCNKRCICVCCHNHPGNEAEIYKARQVANYRNPGHFKGIPALVPARRCTCKKSSCRKNYCECFRAGVKCGLECECLDCHNGRPHDHQDFSRDFGMESESLMEIYVAT